MLADGTTATTNAQQEILQPDGSAITYDVDGGGAASTVVVFLAAGTNYAMDTNKTVNRTDVVGSQNQRVSEGSLADTFNYDMLAIRGAGLGDETVSEAASGTNPIHGLTAGTQFYLTPAGLRRLMRSTNMVTIRLWLGCSLDAKGNADLTTAKDVIDFEKCHLSANNTGLAAGGDETVSVTFEPETVTFPASATVAPT